MDLFRMIFCVFFKDLQRGILFRAIFFYYAVSFVFRVLFRAFISPSVFSRVLHLFGSVLPSASFPDPLFSGFSRLTPSAAFFPTHLSFVLIPLLRPSLYPVSPVFSSLLPSTSSPFFPSLPATSAPLFFRLPLLPPLLASSVSSLLPASSLLFGSHPSGSHPSGSLPFGLLPSGSSSPPPSWEDSFIFLLPRLRFQPRPFARACSPMPLWNYSADRDLSLHVAVSRCRSWTRFRP